MDLLHHPQWHIITRQNYTVRQSVSGLANLSSSNVVILPSPGEFRLELVIDLSGTRNHKQLNNEVCRHKVEDNAQVSTEQPLINVKSTS